MNRTLLIVVSFFAVAFDRGTLVPKPGTVEYVEFIPGEYKLSGFLVDPISEETVMSLYDQNGKLDLKIRHKFDRLNPLTAQTKSVKILTSDAPHNNPSERKVFIIYFGLDENGVHLWNYVECIFIPLKNGHQDQKKDKGANFVWPILTHACASCTGFYFLSTTATKSSCQLPPIR